MGAGALVLGALKTVGSWVLSNPNVTLDVAERIAKIKGDKQAISNEEHLQIVDEQLNQLGAAALELDQKFDAEITLIRKQLRTMKIMMSITGALLGIAVVATVLLVVLK